MQVTSHYLYAYELHGQFQTSQESLLYVICRIRHIVANHVLILVFRWVKLLRTSFSPMRTYQG